MLVALLAAAIGVIVVQGRDMLDVKVWAAVLVIQAIPYAASLILSLISAFPKLPASLVGTMGEMPYAERAESPRS